MENLWFVKIVKNNARGKSKTARFIKHRRDSERASYLNSNIRHFNIYQTPRQQRRAAGNPLRLIALSQKSTDT